MLTYLESPGTTILYLLSGCAFHRAMALRVYACVHMHVKARGPRCFFRQGLSAGCVVTDLARLDGQRAQVSTCLHLPFHLLILYMCRGTHAIVHVCQDNVWD